MTGDGEVLWRGLPLEKMAKPALIVALRQCLANLESERYWFEAISRANQIAALEEIWQRPEPAETRDR